MAKNVSSKFELNAGLFGDTANSSVSATHDEASAPVPESLAVLFSPADESEHRPLGVTQGKKGAKARRINMAFSDDNHAFIHAESRRLGLSATQLVNMLIEQYRERKKQ